MGGVYKLIIEDDEGKTTVVPLRWGEVSIGRMDGNTIRLMERNISRRHAKLTRDNGVVWIEDLNSFNGVKINGERIDARIKVNEGDLVEIGDYHLALQRAEVEDSSAPPDRAQTAAQGTQAGTVPDFRLPEEILADAQNGGMLEGGPQPLVSPPPTEQRKGSPVLPPFPSPGGLTPPANPFFNPNSAPSIAEGHVARTEQIKVGPSPVSDVPRIICVSTEYAGREFALNRPEVIIGRTEDNDIVIEHRSVSRNHAKILFDGRVHKIIDLESANGILVNGEEYAITDLRKGDLIELGHVRFRFIPASEAFTPSEEEAKSMLEAGVTPPPMDLEPKTIPAPGDTDEVEPPSPAKADAILAGTETVEMGVEVRPDPSTAATVTDTPLSALNVPELFEPKIEPDAGQKTERVDTSEHETRATDVAPPRPSRRQSSQKPPIEVDDDFDEPPRGKGKLLAVLAFLGLIVVVLLALAIGGGGSDGEADEALRAMYDGGEYAKVEAYYLEHDGEFTDKKAALRMVLESKEKLRGAAAIVPAARPAPTPPPEPEPEPEPEPAELGDMPEGSEPEVAEVAPKPKPKTKKKKKKKSKKKAGSSGKSMAKAMDYERVGRRALLEGDLQKAERYLKLCLRTAEYPYCHRQLGILYASKDDTRRAIRHYQRYIELKPDAKDADQVRAHIEAARGQR